MTILHRAAIACSTCFSATPLWMMKLTRRRRMNGCETILNTPTRATDLSKHDAETKCFQSIDSNIVCNSSLLRQSAPFSSGSKRGELQDSQTTNEIPPQWVAYIWTLLERCDTMGYPHLSLKMTATVWRNVLWLERGNAPPALNIIMLLCESTYAVLVTDPHQLLE